MSNDTRTIKRALILGAGGFIGGHLSRKLKSEGYFVRGVDIKRNPWMDTMADEFLVGDLRDNTMVNLVIDGSFDEIYQLAADMGGAGFVFTGENDAEIMHNSATINLNVCEAVKNKNKNCVLFYSSSACMYPEHNQQDPNNPNCKEDSAYPAAPDSEYGKIFITDFCCVILILFLGWEKLFSERLFLAYHRNFGLNVRIARFHNIFGPLGSWNNGREKSPAALCRKVAMALKNGDNSIEVWGDGTQTRSYLFIEECLEGVKRLVRQSDFIGPVNIGSEEMLSIREFAEMIIKLSGADLTIKYVTGPVGVAGRNSDNNLIAEKLGWAPSKPLIEGLTTTYNWITEQIEKGATDYQY